MVIIYIDEQRPFGKTVLRPNPQCGFEALAIWGDLCQLCGQDTLTHSQIAIAERLGFSFKMMGNRAVGGTGNGQLICAFSIHNKRDSEIAHGSLRLPLAFFYRRDWAKKLLSKISQEPETLADVLHSEYSKDNYNGLVDCGAFKIIFTIREAGL